MVDKAMDAADSKGPGTYVDGINWDHPVKFLWLIGLIDRGVQRSLQDQLRPYGLSLPEYSALSVLNWSPGLSNADLARRALVTPQSMNEVVARLEGRDLVVRESHPVHGRILMTEVTTEGRTLLLAAMESIGIFETTLLEGLSDAEVEVVKSLLLSVLDRLHRA